MNLLLLSNHQSATGHKALAFVIEALGLKGQVGGYIGSEPDPEGDFYRATQAFYQGLGIGLNTYLDFEQGFNDTVMQTLLDKPLVHLSGGDTYRFLRGLHSRNQQQKLKGYAASGHLLVGVSAGAMLLTANIETAVLCGDSNTVGLENLKALGLADLLFVPHVFIRRAETNPMASAKNSVQSNWLSGMVCPFISARMKTLWPLLMADFTVLVRRSSSCQRLSPEFCCVAVPVHRDDKPHLLG